MANTGAKDDIPRTRLSPCQPELPLRYMVAFPSLCPHHPCHINELEGRRMRRMNVWAKLFNLFTSLVFYFACISWNPPIFFLDFYHPCCWRWKIWHWGVSDYINSCTVLFYLPRCFLYLPFWNPQFPPSDFIQLLCKANEFRENKEAVRTIFPRGLLTSCPGNVLSPRKSAISCQTLIILT